MTTTDRAEIRTDFLVLRKTPFQETSLILAGVTPRHGQLRLMARGAKRVGRRQFPVLDLFRRVSVCCRAGRGELWSLREVELLDDYSALVVDLNAYRTAGWLAKFALANVLSGVEHPDFFEALLSSYGRLARARDGPLPSGTVCDAAVVGALTTYLHEAGWLDSYERDSSTADRCRLLLGMARGQSGVPALDAETWTRLRGWLRRLLQQAECHLPREADGRLSGDVDQRGSGP